ncbi:hypothetical protein I3V23_09135 [Rhodobacterales bacterium HKCCA1288]|nr:hypothetical protein I3V23_09135 [Rhodobacterales bacterium HKCCA1288]
MVQPDIEADIRQLEVLFQNVSRILLEHFQAEMIDAKTADIHSVKLVQACLRHVGNYSGRATAAQAATDIEHYEKILKYCDKIKKSGSKLAIPTQQRAPSIHQIIQSFEDQIEIEISYRKILINLPGVLAGLRNQEKPDTRDIENSRGRPPHTGANGVAVETAKQFERLTGKPATLSNFTSRDRNRFGGRYYEFLKDILEIFDLDEHVDGAARHGTKRISSK